MVFPSFLRGAWSRASGWVFHRWTAKARDVYFSIFRALFIHLNKVMHIFTGKPYYAGLYNDHKLHHFIDNAISMSNGSIELAIPLNIIAVDLISGLPVVIKSGDVGLAVQASTAIPTLRQPIPINDQLLVDGGVLKNNPVEEVKKMGADIVITVDVDAKLETIRSDSFTSYEGIITRVIALGLQAQSRSVLDRADVIIIPDLNGVGFLDLNPKSLSTAIRVGEEAAQKAIPLIKKVIKQKEQILRVAER